MKYITLLLSLSLLFQIACTTKTEEVTEIEPVSLEGTWTLIAQRQNHPFLITQEGGPDTSWYEYPETVIYQKHITPTHFTWIRFEKDKDSLVGTGGGTYTYDDATKTYTEDIQFFFPPGSNELGQAIPFSVEMKDGRWHHKGYAKVFEFDPDIGENVVTDSLVIDEIWERTDVSPTDATNGSLVGTWNQQSNKSSGDSLWTEWPSFVGYMKLVTPTHFVWVKYNTEGDEVMGAGGGSYTLSDDQYIEHLQFFHPTTGAYSTATSTFNYSLNEDEHWQISGSVDDGSGASNPFEEIWEKYK